MLIALAALIALIALAGASSAAAEVYGGLGPVGTTIKSGSSGGHGEVNAGGQAHGHAFAVDTKNGDVFVADEVTVSGQAYARLQEFNAAGEFQAENRISLKQRKEEEQEVTVERVAGLAVDASRNRVYLLLAEHRRENKEAVEEKLIKVEKESTKTEKEKEAAENKGETQRVKELKEQLEKEQAEEKQLGDEEEALDSEDTSASDLYSFSTEAASGELKEKKTAANSALLESGSETPRQSLLNPTGIAVDPKNGEVIVLGEQNEATTPSEGNNFRAAAEWVHVGSQALGPRYVDKANCLDGAAKVASEPRCQEDDEEEPASPIVTSEGRVIAQVDEELWEIPASAEASGGYKEIEVTPRFLFDLQGETVVKEGTLPEEEGGTLSFAPGAAATEGTIYLKANFTNAGENGVVRLHYSEAGGHPEVAEEGWTAGQEKNSTQTECIVPGESKTQPLIAAGTGQQVLMLSYFAGRVMAFGPGAGAEACGQKPAITPPSIEAANKPQTEVEVGQAVTLSSTLAGARAIGAKWDLEYTEPGGQKGTEEVTTPYAIQDKTLLSHAFAHEGTYTITETADTDSLAYPAIVAEAVKLKVTSIKAALGLPEPFTAGQEATIEASVKDLAEAPIHLKAVWSFGDGSPAVQAEYERASSPFVIETKHAYAAGGSYTVTLEVSDKSGAHATVTIPVSVTEKSGVSSGGGGGGGGSGSGSGGGDSSGGGSGSSGSGGSGGSVGTSTTSKPAPPTRAQLLAKALKTCKKESKKKRAQCEAAARKKYGPKAKTKGKKKK